MGWIGVSFASSVALTMFWAASCGNLLRSHVSGELQFVVPQ